MLSFFDFFRCCSAIVRRVKFSRSVVAYDGDGQHALSDILALVVVLQIFQSKYGGCNRTEQGLSLPIPLWTERTASIARNRPGADLNLGILRDPDLFDGSQAPM